MKTNCHIGFLGFGNMAQAMVQGLLKAEVLPAEQIHACAKHYDKLCRNAAHYGICPHESAEELLAACQVLVVAVKPYMVKELLQPLAPLLKDKIVFAVTAGLRFDDYEQLIPGVAHWGCIPNTPVSVCQGIYICEEKHSLSEEQHALVEELFAPTGLLLPLNEKEFGPGSTLAGCGPAFAAMFMEALADGALRNGLSRSNAYRLAAQMLLGTAQLQLDSGAHPAAMKDAVCSPGGLTIRGVVALEEDGFRSAVIHAIDAAEGK